MNIENYKISVKRNELLQCSKNREILNAALNREKKEISDGIYEICHYYPCSVNALLNNIEICPSEETLIDYSKLNYYDFLRLLCKTLDIDVSNININKQSEDVIIDLINNKSNILKSLNNIDKFKELFPSLNRYYDIALKSYKTSNAKIEFGDKSDKNDLTIKYLFNQGFKPKLFGTSNVKGNQLLKYVKNSSFCECQANAINQMIRHKDEIKDYLDGYKIDRNLYANYKMDNDKFLVYLLAKYIEKADTLNGEDRLGLLKLVGDRIDKVKDKNTYVLIDNNTVSYVDVCHEYKRVLEGKRTIYLNKDIVTKGPNNNHVESNNERKVKVLSVEDKEQLVSYNEELLEFYENTGYIGKLIVKKGFEGDRAYVYPNGEIIIDYIAPSQSDSDLKKLKGRGIYHTNIHDFNRLQGTSRMRFREILRKEHPDSKVFTTHKGNYQERVLDMINEGFFSEFNEEITRLFLDNLEEENKSKKR